MNKLDEMNELVLSAEQILENMKAIRDKPEEPKLYDGLTEEQWQIVMDENLICSFWDIGKIQILSILKEVDYDSLYPFSTNSDDWWTHCEIHESQPQFCNGTRPDVLEDDDVIIVFYTSGGYSTGSVDTVIDWLLVERWQRVEL